jgi:hypothetical protein
VDEARLCRLGHDQKQAAARRHVVGVCGRHLVRHGQARRHLHAPAIVCARVSGARLLRVAKRKQRRLRARRAVVGYASGVLAAPAAGSARHGAARRQPPAAGCADQLPTVARGRSAPAAALQGD